MVPSCTGLKDTLSTAGYKEPLVQERLQILKANYLKINYFSKNYNPYNNLPYKVTIIENTQQQKFLRPTGQPR